MFGAQLISQILNLQKRDIKTISRSSFDVGGNHFFCMCVCGGRAGGGGVGLTNSKIFEDIKLQIGKVMYLYK